jgi:uncharacterized protein (TIGR02145 family)
MMINENRISGATKRTGKVLLFVSLLAILITCEKPERILKFDTLEAETTDISCNAATLKGEITDLGSKPIEQHGILLSESSVPGLGQQNTIEKPLGTISKKGVFQAEFTGLKSNMTYYFRAFVVVDGTSELASIKQFQTSDSQKPTVTAGTVTGITMTSASLDGEVTSDGGEPTTVRGLCWSLSANPTITGCLDTTKNGTGSGTFTGNMTGLTAGTQYYARTYATNSKGASYNDADITFKTHSLPVVTTSAITNISTTSASSGGEVTDDGGVTVTARGVCWSTTTGPTVALTTRTENGTGEGEFTSSITGLTPETTYYVRAYATNQYGTSYGAELSFTASASVLPPSATTSSATPVGTTTATLNGLVNANGLSTTVTFEYGTTTSYGQTATAAESPVTGSSATSVSAAVTGLLPSTTYHFRVKAVSSGGTAYGNDMTFTTNAAPIAPAATTGSATSVSSSGAILNGTVNANNSSTTVTFEYGTTTSYGTEVSADQNPVTGSTETSVSKSISGLSASTTYHYRVKAVSAGGTAYGDDMTFTTLTPPTATTESATEVKSTSATLNGTVNANNSSTTVTFEYGETTSYGTEVTADQSPVSGNTNTSVNKSISGLSESTTYHFRVKAASPGGTIYGDDMTFTTIDLPIVTTGIVHDIKDVSAIAEGEVIGDGGADITERGICYSTSTNPTVSDNKVNNAGDIGFFSVTLTGLNPSTKYYYRAYAINIGGTSYGNEYNFITMSSTNLLAYYPFNNNVEDESGNGNHGINNGAIPTYDRFGNANSAMLFNNSYIDCNNSLLPETGDFTINMWVYPDSLACALWGQYAFNTYGRIFAGIDQPSGKVFFFHSSDGSVDIATFNPIETKKWYMLSFIREGNELKIYLNGSIQETGSLTPMNILQRKFLIGIQNESYDLDEGFNGIIDDVRIYDGALTQNDLNNLYQENGWTGELTVCDYDGNPYYVVHIGTQLWMHENLKVIHYNNGGIIPNIAGDTEWEASTSGAYCWYNNNKTTYGDTYGALYKWYTVSTGNLCPTGWHVPTDAEWTILTDYLGGESVAGGKLKETGTTHWTSPNEGATNESGFNALPGGVRLYSGMFNGLSGSSYWWSSTEANASSGYDRVVLYYTININRSSINKKSGCYVRCIKD